MRRRAALTLLVLAACGEPAERTPSGYLRDPVTRRRALEASLVEPTNGYSRLRLAQYEPSPGAGWAQLPEDARPGTPWALGSASPAAVAPWPLDDGRAPGADDPEALTALGREAFFRYPVQNAPSAVDSITTPEQASAFGLWIDPERGVGGVVRDADGRLALTCSTCHAARLDGGLVAGLPNARFDLGKLLVASLPVADQAGLHEALEAASAWGPGRLDVSSSSGREPVRIPDLRPVALLSHLHHDATVAQHDTVALAIRIETLIITSRGASLRPPREIALGLALFVRALAPAPAVDEPSSPGAALFAARCASCHRPPSFSGPPVLLDEIGTDPVVGRSASRGTGRYRVPSLRGVATRGPLLHDGTVPDLPTLLDPARESPSFVGGLHGVGAIRGHRYGLDLDDASRAALLAYLRTL